MKLPFHQKQVSIPFKILIFFGVLMFFMGIFNHYFFKTVTYDYGNYNFAFWDYSHFRISQIPTFRGTFLQDHFSFTLMYFVPVYWLLNWLTQTYTLIIIQQTLILVAAWYTYKLIKLKSDNLWLGAGVIVYYFLLLGRFTTFSADVNLAIISSCFIPIFIYYFKIKRYLISLIILILSLFSRENIPIWFVFIFIVLIIDHRKDKKAVLFSVLGIIISIVYFVLLFKVFIPSIETPGVKYALFNYAALGATPGEAILYIIQNPIEAFKLFFVNHLNNPKFDGIKAEFYWVYLISGGFILFRRPQYLIWFIPIVAQKVLNDSPTRWSIATYYSIEVVTLLPLSVFLTLSSIKSKKIIKWLVIFISIASLAMTIHKLDRVNNKAPWLLNTSKVKVYGKSFYEAPFNIKKVNSLLKRIPPDAKVSASNMLLPHLAQREKIYFFPKVKDAEYIVFSVHDNHYLFSQMYNERERNKYFSDPKWEIIGSEFPVFLFKRNNFSTTDTLANKYHWSATDTLVCDYEKLNSDEEHTLLSKKEKLETIKYRSDEVSLSGNFSIKITPENKYSTKIFLQNINPKDYIEISVWYYTNKNAKGYIVADCGKRFHFYTKEIEDINSKGWKKLVLSFWLPQKPYFNGCSFYLGNHGTEPIYFDDLQVIKKTMFK